jgi:hypothetical protein
MRRSYRLLPTLDCLEDKVLLSVGHHDPAAMVHKVHLRRINTGGFLRGSFVGNVTLQGVTITAFDVVGRVGVLGRVRGSFNLADNFIPIGGRLDLSGSTLTLAGAQGAIELELESSYTGIYTYKVVGGSGRFADTESTGVLGIRALKGTAGYAIRLRMGG